MQGWADRAGGTYRGDLGRTCRKLAALCNRDGQVEASPATLATLARAAGLHIHRTQEVLGQLREMRSIKHLPRRDGKPAMWQLVAAQPVTVKAATSE